jgi:hypothetical protein
MKTHVLRALSVLSGLLLSLTTTFAAPGTGSIMGQITDPETKEPIEFATVIFESQGTEKFFTTDEKGFYYASNIPAGTYTITISYLSAKTLITDIKLGSDEVKEVNVGLAVAQNLPPVTIPGDHIQTVDPILNRFDPTAQVLTPGKFRDAPITKLTDVATMFNIPEIDGNFFVRGARDGGLAWYVDGCKIMGNPNVPICGVQVIRSYTGFIPAKYGDTNGGIIAVETRSWFTE